MAKIAASGAVLVAVAFTAAAFADGMMLFAAGGFWALAIVLVPFVADRPPARLVSIWTPVVLTVAIGLTARGLLISFSHPDETTIDRMWLLGKGPGFFVQPLVLLLAGLGALTAGFLFRQPEAGGAWRRIRCPMDPRKVAWLGLAVLVISVAASLGYAAVTGGIIPDSISAKRTPIPGLETGGSGYRSFGILRHLSSLAIFAHLVVLALAMRTRRARDFGLAFGLLFAACLQPFYASVRTEVATNLILSASVMALLARKQARWPLAGFGIAAVVAVTVMTSIRPGLEGGKNPVEAVVLNRNQIELPKTAHIVRAIPDRLEYQYGATFARWIAAPVPREFWPGKPVIHPGPVIGNRVYGQRVAGVPPGMVAEWFWNFGWLGVGAGCFAFGAGLRWVESRLGPGEHAVPERVVLYVAGPLLLGYEAVGSSLGSGLFQCVFGLAAAGAMLWLVGDRSPKSEVRDST